MSKITERIDRITLLTQAHRSPTPPVPRSVKIELTARCDFQCFFCASHMRLRPKDEIDQEFFRRIVTNGRDPQQFHDVTRVRAADFCGLYASSIRYDDAQPLPGWS